LSLLGNISGGTDKSNNNQIRYILYASFESVLVHIFVIYHSIDLIIISIVVMKSISLEWKSFLFICHVLYLVCPMLPVPLACPFLILPLQFSLVCIIRAIMIWQLVIDFSIHYYYYATISFFFVTGKKGY